MLFPKLSPNKLILRQIPSHILQAYPFKADLSADFSSA